MRSQTLLLALLITFGFMISIESTVWAQRGRGRGFGGSKPKPARSFKQGSAGRGSFETNGNSGREFGKGMGRAGAHDSNFSRPEDHLSHSPNRNWIAPSNQVNSPNELGGLDRLRTNPRPDRRWLTEQRKLEHRQQVANHLRQVGEMNGNPQLAEVADRLDVKAEEHFRRQLEKINLEQFGDTNGILAPEGMRAPGDPLADPPVSVLQPPGNPSTVTATDGALTDSTQDGQRLLESTSSSNSTTSTTDSPPVQRSVLNRDSLLRGRENAYQNRFLAEEHKLNQRLSVAQRLRQMGEQQGNPQLLQASTQMEEMALQHYTDQLARLTDFESKTPAGNAAYRLDRPVGDFPAGDSR